MRLLRGVECKSYSVLGETMIETSSGGIAVVQVLVLTEKARFSLTAILRVRQQGLSRAATQ